MRRLILALILCLSPLAASAAEITAPPGVSVVGGSGQNLNVTDTPTFNAVQVSAPVPGGPLTLASKAYVDGIAQGLSIKNSVKAATTSNITLSGTQTIDGYALVAGDRVLVKDQSTGSQNGIYEVAAGAWTRTLDADTDSELPGSFTFVENGTTNIGSGWVTPTNPITLGVTSISYTQFSAAGYYSAGTGLTLTGGQFSLTTPVSVGNGGTGSGTAAGAPFALKGANSDITSLTGLTTPLSTPQGGTGVTYINPASQNTITSGPVTLTKDSAETQVFVLSGTGAITVTLPDASTCPGKPFTFYTKTVSGTDYPTIQTISGNIFGLGRTTQILDQGQLTWRLRSFYDANSAVYAWAQDGYPTRATITSGYSIGGGLMVMTGATTSARFGPGDAPTAVGQIPASKANGNVWLAQGATGQPLISAGSGVNPAFGTLGATGGGTGQTSYTTGDLLYSSATNVLSKLTAGGGNMRFLRMVAGVPIWLNVALNAANTISTTSSINTDTTASMLRCDATAGSFVVTLPTLGTDRAFVLQKVDATANTITINTNAGASEIESSSGLTSSITLTQRGQKVFLYSNAINAKWEMVIDPVLPVVQGGTGSTTASGARTNLGVAASGANSDITSLSALSTPLSVPQGGTGAATLTVHGVVLGNATSAVNVTSAGTAGHVLTSNGASLDPTFQSLPGSETSAVPFQRYIAYQANSNTAATISVTGASAHFGDGLATGGFVQGYRMVNAVTAASTNDEAYIYSSVPVTRPEANPTLSTVVSPGSDETGAAVRYVVGFINNAVAPGSDGAATHSAYFSYLAGTDTNWQCKTSDGSTTNTTDSGVAVTDDGTVAYTLKIVVEGGGTTYKFYINGTLVQTHTTTLPTVTTDTAVVQVVRTLGAVAKTFKCGILHCTTR